MKLSGTYYDLFVYSKDLNDFALERPAVAKLLAGGYERFETLNTVHLTYLRENIQRLYDENIRKDENDNMIMLPDNSNFEFKSSEHEKDFNAGWAMLMNRECKIVIGR